jgi:hypothetical protein
VAYICVVSDTAELHRKVLGFISGELARKEGRQCMGIDLLYSPGNGYKDDDIRKWVRADEPELFDNFVNVEKLVTTILEIAEDEANAKSPGRHRFVIRTHQHLGGRAILSFALSPSWGGGDETALAIPGGGGGVRGDATNAALNTINSHAGQLMRINQQMYEGTIRVLGAQNQEMRQENSELRAENILLRREVDEARSNKMDREFQIAMAAEKNARTNAGFQKVLQIGTVIAAKIGGNDEGQNGTATPLAMLLAEFGKSLRPDQIGALMGVLDMAQKMMFMEIMNMVMPKDDDSGAAKSGPGPASLPASGPNGTQA